MPEIPFIPAPGSHFSVCESPFDVGYATSGCETSCRRIVVRFSQLTKVVGKDVIVTIPYEVCQRSA